MQRKSLTQLVFFTLCIFIGVLTQAQTSISIVPTDCYSGVTPAQQNANASSSGGTAPFATWKAAYNYAHASGSTVTTINFAPGTYSTNLSGLRTDWGDADGGFVLKAGLTVNGNGAVIDNTGAGSSAICFATMGNNSIISGFTFIDFTGNVTGGAISAQSATGWQVNNCNFDGCDKAGGSGMEISGGSGTLNGCNFYSHLFATGSAMDISGGNTTLNNCIYSCNYRDNNGGRGGAIYQTGGTTTFNSCVFDGNIAGGNAPGGAISIGLATVNTGAVANFNNTKFTCNEANTLTDQDGGAINCERGVTVSITECNFTGNIAKRQGGAIRSAGGSSSSVNLTISNSTFNNNSTNTSSSKGGAIYLYNTITNLSGSYFSGNTVTGEGGAIYVATNQSGNTATYTFNSNTMTGNTAATNMCTGQDVFTDMHITGTNNKLDALADGWHATNPTNSGSLEFNTTTTTLNTTLSGSTYTGASVATTFGSKNYWVFNGYTASAVEGFNSGQKGMAYVLAADGSNFNTADGLAVVFWIPPGATTRKLSFVSFTGGLDANANITVLEELADYGSSTSGSFCCKVIHDGSDWKFYVKTAGGDITAEDPRGYNYCTPTDTYTGALSGTHRGIWKSNGSGSYIFSKNYFRVGDETTGTGGLGSTLAAACSSCPDSPASSPQCPSVSAGSIQGDVFSDLNMDGIMNTGEQLANITVELLDGSGNVVATTTTNSMGHYIFPNLSSGNYQVRFGIPSTASSATTTMQNQGAPAFDSDVTSGSGTTFLSPMIALSTTTGLSDGTDAFTGAANYYNVTAGYQSIILPVTWASIDVESRNCKNILNWSTASESNNDYFEIERSNNGRQYLPIGQVKGNGDKKTVSEYSFIDEKNTGSTSFYRIKQVDYDGKMSFSSVMKANKSLCNENASISVFPNPVVNDGMITLIMEGFDDTQDLNISIYNQIGVLILSKNIQATALNDDVQLNTESLPAGIYTIAVNQSGGSQNFQNLKFVKI